MSKGVPISLRSLPFQDLGIFSGLNLFPIAEDSLLFKVSGVVADLGSTGKPKVPSRVGTQIEGCRLFFFFSESCGWESPRIAHIAATMLCVWSCEM